MARGTAAATVAVFLAAPAQSYRQLLGAEHLPSPVYDTAHIERLLAREILPRAFDVGPIGPNPSYDAKAARGTWAWLGSRAFFGLVIVLVVAVLGVGLVRAGKTALINTQEDEKDQ